MYSDVLKFMGGVKWITRSDWIPAWKREKCLIWLEMPFFRTNEVPCHLYTKRVSDFCHRFVDELISRESQQWRGMKDGWNKGVRVKDCKRSWVSSDIVYSNASKLNQE